MGDTCCGAESMGAISALITSELPGAFVHSIQIGTTEDEDLNAGFFGVALDHVAQACKQIKSIPLLADGFNAIGFSQGGQFLRAYVETCDDGPRVHNLITYGSQHMGIADAPNCADKDDAQCSLMRRLLRNGAYLPWIQQRVVQAQYFKDPRNYAGYLAQSLFLAKINNEVAASRNTAYRDAVAALNRLVLIKFADEATVVPAETSWFGYYDEDLNIVEMVQQQLYIEDWIGIRSLNENGRLDRLVQKGVHVRLVFLCCTELKLVAMQMNIDEDFFVNEIIPKYLANAITTAENVLVDQSE
ncbi:Palmitoyl-protein thioesterase 1 [Entophlyctis luteolus]|nr:Palmitoyl-protein thioesterase 1 [Entophlyctis luteolus]